MRKLMTQGEVCELLRISYSTLCRMMNAGNFLNPVNGRGRKLLFCSEAVEAWINARQSQQAIMPAGIIPNPAKKQKQRDKDKQRRLENARAALERHRKKTG